MILVTVFVLVMTVSVMAATPTEPSVEKDNSARTVTVSGSVSDCSDNQQVVILVIKSTASLSSLSESDVAYIDQAPVGNDGKYTFNFAIDKSKGDGFVVYIGGTDVSSTKSASFSFAGGAGDINGDSKVNLDDYMVVINAFGSVSGVDEEYNPKADLKADGKINLDDYMVVINNFGNVY